MEIIPAILAKDFAELESTMERVKGLVPLVQIDVSDGKFTPEATWPYRKQDDNFNAIVEEKKGFPYWEELDFEVHLMVEKPEDAALSWVTAGATRIIAHIETGEHFKKFIEITKELVEIGVAINLDTPFENIAPFIDDVDIIQCMGIKRVGFQGEAFDPIVIETVRELRLRYGGKPISVDGGVNLDNAGALLDSGANRLVVGSAILKSDDVKGMIEQFKSVV